MAESSDDTLDPLQQAEREAKLALLQRITMLAGNPMAPSGLKDLAAAFALTVGAKYGELPGGIDVKVSQ
ncbi:Uncharacterised protein [Mycobacteroides abscessus]|nr:Uncharacterised protein [Mycobacteroides abscessus]CPS29266.1 Uncharacterised protein [Mycobacteroides abscessus]CPS48473.1 Uncharacterised protein [Mycobacteroides abscessus]CPT28868.1 Uncharacterised protein [Mycobacteroides abscessus]CPT42648.1 Uncharacterised protein [Mycobacteroides abscessus]